MGTDDQEEEPLATYGFTPTSSGEVYIFWSTGHETLLYSGDETTALKKYRKALTFSNKRLEQLPRETSKVRIREHHIVEFFASRTWDIDPIRTREKLQNPKAWEEARTTNFTGKISTVSRSSGYGEASIVTIRYYAQLLPLIWHLHIASNYRTLVIIGDDPIDEAEQNSSYIKAISSKIADAVRTYHGVAVVDRGRKSIVNQLLGAALNYQGLPYVGVACARTVSSPNDEGIQEANINDLELAHTVFLLVPGTQRTNEAIWLAKTASVMAGTRPSVALLIHGNEDAWADVFAQLREHRRVVALEGTGGVADLLASAVRGEQVNDERAAKCVASGLIRTLPIDAFDEIERLLKTLVFPFPSGLNNIGIPEYEDLEQEFVEVSGTTIKIYVPRLRPILGKEDWFTIEKWFVKEDDIIKPGDVLVSIECAPGFFEISTPPQAVEGPCRISRILVPAGGSTHLGELILVLEQNITNTSQEPTQEKIEPS
jgi:hypothetical protein